MKVAILTFEGFNELDSFVALGILNRMKSVDWSVQITCPTPSVTSMNGVTIAAQRPLEFANEADVVLFGSGIYTRDIARDQAMLDRLKIDPDRQLIGAQCSGTLLLATLGLLKGAAACTDLTTRPWIEDSGVSVLDQAFVANGNIATAGGCLSSQYLATWVIARMADEDAASHAIHYVAPVGEKEQTVSRCLSTVRPYL